MALKAIETQYKGCRFRSRLEARWAVFFDAMGIAWEYEKEGFDLGAAGWYLPDFWLPVLRTWVEVKGAPEDMIDAVRKAMALCLQSDLASVIIVNGVPGEHETFAVHNETCNSGGGLVATDYYSEPRPMQIFTRCAKCGPVFRYYGWVDDDHVAVDSSFVPLPSCSCTNLSIPSGVIDDSVVSAFFRRTAELVSSQLCATKEAERKARSARFEHGECG